MKVWVVRSLDYSEKDCFCDDYSIDGVFSDRDKAVEYIRKYRPEYNGKSDYHARFMIDEYTVE